MYDTDDDSSKPNLPPDIPPETSEKEEQKPTEKPESPPPKEEKPESPPPNEEEPSTDSDTTTPNKEPDEPTHEKDKHVDKPSEVDKDASKVPSSFPNSETCSGMTCRASVIAGLVAVLFIAIFVGRTIRGRRGARYHTTATELVEVPTLHLDEEDAVDFSTRYRDHPDGQELVEEDEVDVVAEEGVGYEDDDELDPHEIA